MLSAMALFSFFSACARESGFVASSDILSLPDCSPGQICAAGEGSTPDRAEASARASLAAVFKTRVVSTFEQTDLGSMEIKRAYVKTDVDDELDGCRVYTVPGQNGYKSLAVVDKGEYAMLLRSKLDDMDSRMLAGLGDAKKIPELDRLYEKRLHTAGRYGLVSGESVPEPVGFERLAWNKKSLASSAGPYRVAWRGDEGDPLHARLESALAKAGVKVDGGESSASIVGSVSEIKERMNVQGFERCAFVLKIKNEKTGAVVSTRASVSAPTGRCFEQ
ncbi:MAG: LPP20 family lipoprotein, partial [Rickettsiales bacterium]|nr:LPP20 family lipoprotein [Rickettsiales bacterium]